MIPPHNIPPANGGTSTHRASAGSTSASTRNVPAAHFHAKPTTRASEKTIVHRADPWKKFDSIIRSRTVRSVFKTDVASGEFTAADRRRLRRSRNFGAEKKLVPHPEPR